VPRVLLIHGGGHGAWCWSDVQRYLDGAGIASSAFDLPGAGADSSPRVGIDLADYIDATIAQIDAIDDDVVLVGHSIAGLTLPAVTAARPERIAHVLYIAALITEPGERGIDSIPADRRPSYFQMAERSGEYSLLPPFPAAWERFFPSLDEPQARSCYERLTPQPLQPYLDPNPVDARRSQVPRSYLLLEDDRTFPAPLARTFAQRAGIEPIVRRGDHCWMLTDPHACANAISNSIANSIADSITEVAHPISDR